MVYYPLWMHLTVHLNTFYTIVIWLTRFSTRCPTSLFSFSHTFKTLPPPFLIFTLCLTLQVFSFTTSFLLFSPLMCFFCLQEADSCQHCGGSGCAPCSLCHGSKLSMLANRFNESISDLRCQACYPHGLEKCQSCSSK